MFAVTTATLVIASVFVAGELALQFPLLKYHVFPR